MTHSQLKAESTMRKDVRYSLFVRVVHLVTVRTNVGLIPMSLSTGKLTSIYIYYLR